MVQFLFRHETTAKTLTYCAMHFTVAIAVAYIISGNWAIALSIGVVEPLIQTVFFNMHERGWNNARLRYLQTP